jgi:hypothetical protein
MIIINYIWYNYICHRDGKKKKSDWIYNVLDTSYKFAKTTTEKKNIIVHDNYIYLIWILNVNYELAQV